MKLIDEKGRLFEKINVIDFLVVLLLISLTPLLYYGYKIGSYTPPPPSPSPTAPIISQEFEKNILVYVLFKNLPEEYAKKIAVNDRELDSNGKIVAQIKKIERIEPSVISVGKETEKPFSIVDNARKKVFVKMFLNSRVLSNNQLLFKGKPLSINKLIKFKTDQYSIEGIIIEILASNGVFPGLPEKEQFFYESDVVFRRITKEIENLIKVGDKEISLNGMTIAEILEIKGVEPEHYKIHSSIVLKTNDKKRLKARLKILVEPQNNNSFLFKGVEVTNGQPFVFKSKRYTIRGEFSVPPLPPPILLINKQREFHETDVIFKRIPEDMVSIIKEGDKEIDFYSMTIAEILEIKDIKPERDGTGHSKPKTNYTENIETTGKKRIKARVRILANFKTDNTLFYKGKEVRNGQSFVFKSKRYTVRGEFSVPPPHQTQVLLTIRLNNSIPEIYNFIKPGDVMKTMKVDEFTANEQGEKDYIIEARIKRIVSIENAKKEFYSLKRDKLIQVDDLYLKNIVLEIGVLCNESNGLYYFNYAPVLLGHSFTFHNETYQITGLIIEMKKN